MWPNANAAIPDRGVASSFPGPRCCRPPTCSGPSPAWPTRSPSATGASTAGPGRASRPAGVPLARAAGRAPSRTVERHRHPGRHPRRGLLPRRHRPAPVLPEATTDIPVDLTGADRGPGRRRPVHRADRPGRPQRPRRLRPGPGGAAGGDGRPGPPRAARSGPTTWARTCPPAATRWSTSATTGVVLGDLVAGDGDRASRRRRPRPPAPACAIADLGPDGIAEVLRVADAFVEVGQRANPQGAGPAGPDGGHPVLRGLHPHPARPSRRRPSGCRPTCCPSPPARPR